MISDVRAVIEQATVNPITTDEAFIRMSKIGQLWTADWKYKLAAAGKCFRLSIGTISGGDAHTMVGNGTTVDLDIPQGLVAVDSGVLIPMEFEWAGGSDADAENDVVDVLVTADRSQATSAAQIAVATATAETPDNLLDGGETFSGRACSIATVALTDPVHSDLLYFNTWEAIGADELIITNFHCHREWNTPTFLAGPCTLLVYFGGTVAVTGMGSLVFAHVPSSWIPTS